MKKIISFVTVITFIFTLSPVPPAYARHQDVNGQALRQSQANGSAVGRAMGAEFGRQAPASAAATGAEEKAKIAKELGMSGVTPLVTMTIYDQTVEFGLRNIVWLNNQPLAIYRSEEEIRMPDRGWGRLATATESHILSVVRTKDGSFVVGGVYSSAGDLRLFSPGELQTEYYAKGKVINDNADARKIADEQRRKQAMAVAPKVTPTGKKIAEGKSKKKVEDPVWKQARNDKVKKIIIIEGGIESAERHTSPGMTLTWDVCQRFIVDNLKPGHTFSVYFDKEYETIYIVDETLASAGATGDVARLWTNNPDMLESIAKKLKDAGLDLVVIFAANVDDAPTKVLEVLASQSDSKVDIRTDADEKSPASIDRSNIAFLGSPESAKWMAMQRAIVNIFGFDLNCLVATGYPKSSLHYGEVRDAFSYEGVGFLTRGGWEPVLIYRLGLMYVAMRKNGELDYMEKENFSFVNTIERARTLAKDAARHHGGAAASDAAGAAGVEAKAGGYDDPEIAEQKYKDYIRYNTVLTGCVTIKMDIGMFVELPDKRWGLIRNSDLPVDRTLRKNNLVEVIVTRVSKDPQKIGKGGLNIDLKLAEKTDSAQAPVAALPGLLAVPVTPVDSAKLGEALTTAGILVDLLTQQGQTPLVTLSVCLNAIKIPVNRGNIKQFADFLAEQGWTVNREPQNRPDIWTTAPPKKGMKSVTEKPAVEPAPSLNLQGAAPAFALTAAVTRIVDFLKKQPGSLQRVRIIDAEGNDVEWAPIQGTGDNVLKLFLDEFLKTGRLEFVEIRREPDTMRPKVSYACAVFKLVPEFIVKAEDLDVEAGAAGLQRLLIVDNNNMARNRISRHAKQYNPAFEILSVGSIAEALDITNRWKKEGMQFGIMTDFDLGEDKNGLDLAEAVNPPDSTGRIPIILYSQLAESSPNLFQPYVDGGQIVAYSAPPIGPPGVTSILTQLDQAAKTESLWQQIEATREAGGFAPIENMVFIIDEDSEVPTVMGLGGDILEGDIRGHIQRLIEAGYNPKFVEIELRPTDGNKTTTLVLKVTTPDETDTAGAVGEVKFADSYEYMGQCPGKIIFNYTADDGQKYSLWFLSADGRTYYTNLNFNAGEFAAYIDEPDHSLRKVAMPDECQKAVDRLKELTTGYDIVRLNHANNIISMPGGQILANISTEPGRVIISTEARAAGGIERLLIVDDDDDWTQIVYDCASKWRPGLQMTFASSIEEAKRILDDEEPFDAVILDGLLNDDFSFELIEKINPEGRSKTMPIILMSTSVDLIRTYLNDFKQDGQLLECYSKPLDSAKKKQVIEAILNQLDAAAKAGANGNGWVPVLYSTRLKNGGGLRKGVSSGVTYKIVSVDGDLIKTTLESTRETRFFSLKDELRRGGWAYLPPQQAVVLAHSIEAGASGLQRLLIVDDEQKSRDELSRKASQKWPGIEIRTARDINNALAIVEEWERGEASFAIVTDFNLGIENGLDLVLKVNPDNRRRTIPIAIVTSAQLSIVADLFDYEIRAGTITAYASKNADLSPTFDQLDLVIDLKELSASVVVIDPNETNWPGWEIKLKAWGFDKVTTVKTEQDAQQHLAEGVLLINASQPLTIDTAGITVETLELNSSAEDYIAALERFRSA